MSVSNHSSTFAPPRGAFAERVRARARHLEMRGEYAAPRFHELDLAPRVPHDVVAAQLVHDEHEEVRVRHRRERSAERGLQVVASDDVDVQVDGGRRPVVGEPAHPYTTGQIRSPQAHAEGEPAGSHSHRASVGDAASVRQPVVDVLQLFYLS